MSDFRDEPRMEEDEERPAAIVVVRRRMGQQDVNPLVGPVETVYSIEPNMIYHERPPPEDVQQTEEDADA